MKQFYIYILTNKNNTTLYTGVTNNLVRRVYEHKQEGIRSFTKRYNHDKLVYYEIFTSVYEAISREKQIKGGSRNRKIKLVEESNPEWLDLFEEIIG